MVALPDGLLGKLAQLSGYDLILEMDKVSRETGITTSEIEAQIARFKMGGSQQEPIIPAEVQEEAILHFDSNSVGRSPKFIQQPQQYRMKYNPASEAKEKQMQVKQAILCESCGSPLGIPDIRPIEIKCPSCGQTEIYTA